MTGDIPDAAFRLLKLLPVTTHHQMEPSERKWRRPRKMPGVGAPKAVMLDGVRYDSISEAQRAWKVGDKKILKMIETRGRFLDPK